MANNIGWGQGAVNNAIGWGQGAVNNTIGWGSVYYSSFSGETDILGSIITNIIVESFETRVLADGGVFEAESCLKDTLIGLGGMSTAGLYVFNFQQRAFTDEGVCESQTCLNTILTNLNNI